MSKKRYCPKIFYTSSYKLHIQKNTFNSPKKPYILMLKRKIAKNKNSSSNFSDKEILSTTHQLTIEHYQHTNFIETKHFDARPSIQRLEC